MPKMRHMGSDSGPGRRVVVLLALLAGFSAAPAAAQADFQLGLQDNAFSAPATSASSQFDYRALQTIRGTTVKLPLNWASVAPGGATKPAGFSATNPSDPHYNWASVDATVETAAAHHARVLLILNTAPQWAQPPNRPASLKSFPGAWNPSATEFAAFTHAAAVRYGGKFRDPLHPGLNLPRVHYWEIWNEENLPYDLGAPNLVEEYRSLLNDSYAAIKGVDRSNMIVLGGLAPVSFVAPLSIGPLKFAADLFCLRRIGTRFVRARKCPHPAHFDIFADHPYTLAVTPTQHAYVYDDVLIADLGKIDTVLRTAERLHTVARHTRHPIWVTEWSWFTNPPDKQIGDREPVAARYTAYSMYEMWRAGVSFVSWFLVRDPPLGRNSPGLVYGGGLYTTAGREKLVMRAFAFPVVASVSRGRGFVWGRAPLQRRGRVVIQQLRNHHWGAVTTVRTGADGVFQAHFPARSNGTYRARVIGGPTSLAYDSKPIPPKRTHLFSPG